MKLAKDSHNIGQDMYELVEKLYPICRSITGNGVRETLQIIKSFISQLTIHEVPSHTKVYDWTIPKEWNIKDAYILDSKGQKIVDFKKSNLHILNYSIPINKKISLKELKKHLYTLPENPDWIPYRTSYYKEDWGFCLTHKQFQQLNDEYYTVHIDSTLEDGFLTYGELYLKGKKEDEFLLTCYICHPSMCDDNLSGISLLTQLAKYLNKMKLKYSYRFLFIPETIGAITWLNINENKISKIKYGLVATCVGDSGILTYKKTRKGTSKIDIIVEKVLTDSGKPYKIVDFFPAGCDERQFSSPGFNLEVSSLMRTMYSNSDFPEYHTSADNLDFVRPEYLEDSFMKYLKIIFVLENDMKYLNLNSKCEPNLGKRGLYREIGGQKIKNVNKMAMMWVLNFSDGEHSILDISIRSGIPFDEIKETADLLVKKGLLRPIKE